MKQLKHFNPWIIALLFFALILGGLLLFKSAAKDETIESDIINTSDLPKVLIVTPRTNSGYSFTVKKLLQENGFVTLIASWDKVTDDLIDQYDLLIVTGTERSVEKKRVRLGINKPILAYGPYGCKYLGLMNLKNGHPYT